MPFRSRPECRQWSAGRSPKRLCVARKHGRLRPFGHFPGVAPFRAPRQESTGPSWPVRTDVGSGKDKGKSAGTFLLVYRGCVPGPQSSLQSGSRFHRRSPEWRDHRHNTLRTCALGFPAGRTFPGAASFALPVLLPGESPTTGWGDSDPPLRRPAAFPSPSRRHRQ